MRVHIGASCVLVWIITLLISAILAKASPLNQYEYKLCKSLSLEILDVAYLANTSHASSAAIHVQLSCTWIAVFPQSVNETIICVASASSAFSMHSLRIEAGLSTISHALSLLIT